jgi:hypothetical protein
LIFAALRHQSALTIALRGERAAIPELDSI